MKKNIVAYISGHGYGHAAQIAPVLNALVALLPEMRLFIRSDLPEPVLAARLASPFTLLAGEVDVGVVQNDALHEDIPATRQRALDFFAAFPSRVAAEIERLAPLAPAAVISDISPLAFPTAKALGVPGIAVASLDWHAVYSAYLPADDPVLAALAAAHAECDLLLKPPLSMPMPTFPRQQPVGLIVAGPRKPQRAMERPRESHAALVLFGGTRAPAFDVQALAGVPDWHFYLPAPLPGPCPANVTCVRLGVERTAMDLMQCCDVVVGKPGYGMLAECWSLGVPLVYVPRPDFPEYPYLRAWLRAHAPAVELPPAAFRSGDWQKALHAARTHPRSYPPFTDGAGEAAALIVKALGAR